MQALVLVGGEGTRLRPLTLDVPKPALRLVDRPFVRFVVDWLASHGVDEVVMACGFRAEDLRAALGDEVPGGPRIRYLEEPEPLGTGGPLRLAADEGLLEDRFLALNGDVLTDLDLGALIELHGARGAVGSLALYPVQDPSAYGLVRRAEDGEVLEFLEKPDPSEIDTDEISAGAYVLERSVIDLIPAGRAVSIEREVFPRLVGKGLYGCRLDGYWMDIGTPERYLQASWDILEGRVRTEVEPTERGILLDEGARVAQGATIGPRAVVSAGCDVADGARIAESVLLDGCMVGERTVIEGAILGSGVKAEEDSRITKGAVIGAGASIGAGAVVAGDARVQPGAIVAAEAVAP